jgi:hypothetical protein
MTFGLRTKLDCVAWDGLRIAYGQPLLLLIVRYAPHRDRVRFNFLAFFWCYIFFEVV